ncbi:SRPBCC family protein [Streptosporangium sp. NPDC006013]|uniref:SRPBCC family protein n=1 Tax=Streptosporangium sp. NPDC006013 TaxID=3155596 RepID=UPI0033BD416C
MIDVTGQISAVRRRVGSRVLEAGEARVVTVSQTYDTEIEDLWDACTNPERIPRWFLPISGDLRLHGRYQLQGNAGGRIERCDPPKSYAATWEYGGDVSWIEVRLTAEPGGGTRFELEHVAHVDDRWEEFGPGAVGVGWDLGLVGLAVHLSSGQAVDPQEAGAWVASDQGRGFMVLSSLGWYEADVEAGADEARARAAADRVTAAYTAPAAEASSEL